MHHYEEGIKYVDGYVDRNNDLRLPIYYEGNEGDQVWLLNEMNVEIVVSLTRAGFVTNG